MCMYLSLIFSSFHVSKLWSHTDCIRAVCVCVLAPVLAAHLCLIPLMLLLHGRPRDDDGAILCLAQRTVCVLVAQAQAQHACGTHLVAGRQAGTCAAWSLKPCFATCRHAHVNRRLHAPDVRCTFANGSMRCYAQGLQTKQILSMHCPIHI